MNAGGQSLWHRAANTPARDWVRGRLSARLDWRGTIDRAGLPGPLAGLVRELVGRSRLWRGEKADLAAELCAHFTDGLDSGRSTEGLMQDFGDPKRVRKLIRRAKKRGRPGPYRAFVHSLQVLIMLLLGVGIAYGVLAWRFFTGEPNITRNFAAEYNETIEEIPEADRAWPLYLETYAALERVPDDLINSWPHHAPEHPLYGEALAYLERQQAVIELAHTAAARPRLGATLTDALDDRLVDADNARSSEGHTDYQTPSENPMLVGVLLPELGHMRGLARLLTFDAHVAAREGDGARAARDIETMLRIGHHVGDRPVLIGALVEMSIYHLAANTAAQIIHAEPGLFSDEQLLSLAHRFAAVDTDIADGLRGERWMFEDMVQRVYSDDGKGGGHLTAEGMRNLMLFSSLAGDSSDMFIGSSPLGPITATLVADRRSLMEKYEQVMASLEARARVPMWEYDRNPRVNDEVEVLAADPIGRVRYFPIVVLMPALDRAAEHGQSIAQVRDAVTAGIALELYRRENGRYPASLDGLVPAFLPTLPADRFTGEPLRYAVTDGRARLWSVGVDRNDDGGLAPTGARDRSGRWLPTAELPSRLADPKVGDEYAGDWVLWPVVYEPLAADEW